MSKPTVFFSHSSKDSVSLSQFRDLVLKKTGNSVNIFLSSDGQSIQFGRNWVHSIESALKDAAIMFVFLSPASLANPGWVNFESGHAYARDIRVVPVGVFGVRIENVSPPMSLLQGFNINNASSASNIMAIINEVFGLTHSTDFTADEFNKVFACSAASSNSIFGELSSFVEEISIRERDNTNVRGNPEKGKIYKSELEKAAEYLTQKGIANFFNGKTLSTHGLSLENVSSNGEIYIHIDPLISRYSLELLDSIKEHMPTFFKKVGLFLIVKFVKGINERQGLHKVTSRFYNTEVEICPNEKYKFRSCEFSIGHFSYGISEIRKGCSYVKISSKEKHFEDIPIYDLIRILFDTEVLFLSDEFD